MPDNHNSNPHHRPETFSTTIVYKFEDGEGLPLDHPIVKEREQNRKRSPNRDRPLAPEDEGPSAE